MKKVLLLASSFLATTLTVNAQTPSVSFGTKMMTATEGDNTVKIPVVIKNKNVNEPTTVFFQSLGGRSTAGQGFGADVQLTTQSLTFFKNSPDTLYAELLVNDDSRFEITEYFMLQISNVLKGTIGSDDAATIFIEDNDYKGPIARKNLELELLSSFTVGTPGSSAEVIAYDTASNRLYVVNSEKNILHILNFNNPSSLSQLTQLDMSSYGSGIQSVAAYNGLIAVAVQAFSKQDSGKVVFFAADGNKKHEVMVGALPDMVTFTPNGRYLLVANEGEPNDKYTNDPEGSISIIDLGNGVTNATVSFATFTKFNSQAASLKQAGVRIFGANNPSVAQDIEPEYITVNATSDTAWVSLQENNAIAMVLIASASVEAIFPLGTIDHNQLGKGIDASDKSDEPLIANWPVHGMFLPDGIANYTVNGQTYVLTANEGDAREYGPLEEEERVGKLNLDPTVFPHAKVIQEKENLGRLNVTTTLGDIDNDGDYDKLYSFGTRSFSIFNANNFNLVYDSGDDFENIINADPELRKIFNTSNSKNKLKDRSDNKGPEPEAVTVGVINDTAYAFVALERIGGVMVYDITNPSKSVFVDYINTRSVDSFAGDNGAEVVLFIHRDNNIHKKHLLISANEVSSTVAVFEVKAYLPPSTVSVKNINVGAEITVYPNPAKDVLNFDQSITGILYDNTGRIVKNFVEIKTLDVSDLTAGMYFMQVEGYQVQKVIIK